MFFRLEIGLTAWHHFSNFSLVAFAVSPLTQRTDHTSHPSPLCLHFHSIHSSTHPTSSPNRRD